MRSIYDMRRPSERPILELVAKYLNIDGGQCMFNSGRKANQFYKDIQFILDKAKLTVSIDQVEAAYWFLYFQRVGDQLDPRNPTRKRLHLDGEVRTEYKDQRSGPTKDNKSTGSHARLRHAQTMKAAQMALDVMDQVGQEIVVVAQACEAEVAASFQASVDNFFEENAENAKKNFPQFFPSMITYIFKIPKIHLVCFFVVKKSKSTAVKY